MPKNQLPETPSRHRVLRRGLFAAVLLWATTATVVQAGECVILLHGLARTSHSMADMQHALQQAGYQVVNLDYPSRDYLVAELSDIAITPALKACAPESMLHFVTHSLGGHFAASVSPGT